MDVQPAPARGPGAARQSGRSAPAGAHVSEPAAQPSKDERLWVASTLYAVAAELADGRKISISPALLRAAVRLLRLAGGEAEAGEGG